jgi:hypothetical protein
MFPYVLQANVEGTMTRTFIDLAARSPAPDCLESRTMEHIALAIVDVIAPFELKDLSALPNIFRVDQDPYCSRCLCRLAIIACSV